MSKSIDRNGIFNILDSEDFIVIESNYESGIYCVSRYSISGRIVWEFCMERVFMYYFSPDMDYIVLTFSGDVKSSIVDIHTGDKIQIRSFAGYKFFLEPDWRHSCANDKLLYRAFEGDDHFLFSTDSEIKIAKVLNIYKKEDVHVFITKKSGNYIVKTHINGLEKTFCSTNKWQAINYTASDEKLFILVNEQIAIIDLLIGRVNIVELPNNFSREKSAFSYNRNKDELYIGGWTADTGCFAFILIDIKNAASKKTIRTGESRPCLCVDGEKIITMDRLIKSIDLKEEVVF